MRKSLRNTCKTTVTLTALVASAILAPGVRADELIKFDFENFGVGQVTGPASAAAPNLSASHDMVNNGVEDFGAPNFKLSMTRFAGYTVYPKLTFTTTVPIVLNAIEFLHISNHNPTYPTYPDYNVNLEIDAGSGPSVLSTFVAQGGGYLAQSEPGPGVLAPGTYTLGWVPQLATTSSEFFGLDNIVLEGAVLGCDPCAEWKNHGAYVSCVADAINTAVANGDASADEVTGLVASAGQSEIGKKGFVPAACQVQP